MTRGSLGEVLPSSVKALFVSAWATAAASTAGNPEAPADSSAKITWAGHTLTAPGVTDPPRHLRWTVAAVEVEDDFGPL
jgi:hypothetical protein